MTTYIKKMVEDFEYKSEVLGKKATTPAAEYIFEVNQNAKNWRNTKLKCFTLVWPKLYLQA